MLRKHPIIVLLCIFVVLIFIYINNYNHHVLPLKIKNNISKVSSNLNISKYPEEFIAKKTIILRPHNFMKSTLKVAGKSLTIYIYGSYDLISRFIIQYGAWESIWLEQVASLIKLNPGLQLLDVGANLGIYTLTAAALGSQVVAVDANPENVDRLTQSLVSNKLGNRVQLLLNAVSNARGPYTLTRSDVNIGARNIKADKTGVWGVTLDELAPLLKPDAPVLMKIDIEGSETNAFLCADRLFATRKIAAILIEWEWINKQTDGRIQKMIEFLRSRGFKPYTNLNKNSPALDLKVFQKWPIDVVWRRDGIIKFI